MRLGVTLGLAAGIVLSRNLWLSSRIYPLTPVWLFKVSLSAPADRVVLFVLVALLVGFGFWPRREMAVALFGLVALVALQDQSRWQPWFYQYVLMLLAIALARAARESDAMNTCRLIIAATYVWSGLAKLNPNFARDIFPSLVSAFVRMSPSAVQWSVRHLAWMPGLLECAMGVGLVVRAFRRPAAVCAIGMHVLILAVIGPLGSRFNAVVWPWNLAMIFLVSLLFLASGERPPAGDIVWGKGFAFQRIVLVLFGVMPALSFFNLWDAYLSSALYSANRNSGVVYITDDVFYRLPRAIRSYISDEGPNRGGLDIDEWSWGELNVPSYPELRIYRNVARLICGYSRDNTGVELVFQGRLALAGGNRRSVYDCAELVGEPDPSTGLAFR